MMRSFISIFVLFVFGLEYIKTEELRLVGGSAPHEGNIEISSDGTIWKYICDDQWDIRDAKVVCRQLGYAKALKATRKSFFALKSSSIKFDYNSTYWSTHIKCAGDEKSVQTCDNGNVRLPQCDKEGNIAGVVCSNRSEKVQRVPIPSNASGEFGADLKIRLIGESKHGFISSGYLEVLFDGVWGAVCADGWSFAESYVACGNLGYPDVERNRFLPNKEEHISSHYWMNNVQCSGRESSLYECNHAGWKRHVCKRDMPVYLDCKRSPFLRDNRFDKALISKHNLRIRSGYRHSEGRVEIFHQKQWGSICHDNWNIHNANVFCRQLGFGTAFEATHHASFGQGSGMVWLDEVLCKGDEKSIRDCKHAGWGNSDCGHKEDAGVKCHYPYGKPEGKIKLHGHSNPLSGHIRVLHAGKWKGVCGIGFGLREASVVCRQLGLGYPRKALSTTRYGMVREMAMYNVKCSGDELSLMHCHYDGREKGRCRYYDIAAVDCTPYAPDLVLDVEELRRSIHLDSKTLLYLSCAFEENCLGPDAKFHMMWPDMFKRNLIRFTARFWNRGTAHFLPNVRKEYWKWHKCHQHFHSMERFADYDLTDARGMKVSEGHKASFCIEDYECEKGMKKIYKCRRDGGGDQGIQVNCADTYKAKLDCQWVDITLLRPGNYTLRVVLNPQNLVYETDYSNNIASCQINYIDYKTLNVNSCYVEPCEQMSFGGKGDGACCKFPFIYKGKQYHSCTTEGRRGQLWCATTTNYDKDGLWGKCG